MTTRLRNVLKIGDASKVEGYTGQKVSVTGWTAMRLRALYQSRSVSAAINDWQLQFHGSFV